MGNVLESIVRQSRDSKNLSKETEEMDEYITDREDLERAKVICRVRELAVAL
jgi:AmiR/NasT family two-component response regulator